MNLQDKLAYRHGQIALRQEKKEAQRKRTQERRLAIASRLHTSFELIGRFVRSAPRAALHGGLALPKLLSGWPYLFVFAFCVFSMFSTQSVRVLETSADSIVVIPEATFETMTAHLKPSLAMPLWGDADGRRAGVFRLSLTQDLLDGTSEEEFSSKDYRRFFMSLKSCLSSHLCQQARFRALDALPFGWAEAAAPARSALQSLHASVGTQSVRVLSPTTLDWAFFIDWFCSLSVLLFLIQRARRRRQKGSVALLLGHDALVATLFRGIGVCVGSLFLFAAIFACWWPIVAFGLFFALSLTSIPTVVLVSSYDLREKHDALVEIKALDLIERGRFSAERELLRRDLDQHSSRRSASVAAPHKPARRI